MRYLLAAIGTALCTLCAAHAGPVPTPSAAMAYASGQFMEAAETAGRSANAGDRALAARALLAECILTQSQRPDLVDAAATHARAALKADPDSVEARLQLAMAIGLKGRAASASEALRNGYASEGKRLIDEALARAPHEPWAWALLGGWNLEVVRRGGRLGARLYGASTAKGIAAFERARALAPDDPVIALHQAAALLGVDPVRFGDQARVALTAAAAAPADNVFERRMQDEARHLSALMATDGPVAAGRRAQSRL